MGMWIIMHGSTDFYIVIKILRLGCLPIARIVYAVLVETLNHAQSINQSIGVLIIFEVLRY